MIDSHNSSRLFPAVQIAIKKLTSLDYFFLLFQKMCVDCALSSPIFSSGKSREALAPFFIFVALIILSWWPYLAHQKWQSWLPSRTSLAQWNPDPWRWRLATKKSHFQCSTTGFRRCLGLWRKLGNQVGPFVPGMATSYIKIRALDLCFYQPNIVKTNWNWWLAISLMS